MTDTEAEQLTIAFVAHIREFFEGRSLNAGFLAMANLQSGDVVIGSNMKRNSAVALAAEYLASEQDALEEVIAEMKDDERHH